MSGQLKSNRSPHSYSLLTSGTASVTLLLLIFLSCIGWQGCAADRATLQQQDFHQMKIVRARDDALRSAEHASRSRSQVVKDQQTAADQLSEIDLHLGEAKSALSEASFKAQRNNLIKHR